MRAGRAVKVVTVVWVLTSLLVFMFLLVSIKEPAKLPFQTASLHGSGDGERLVLEDDTEDVHGGEMSGGGKGWGVGGRGKGGATKGALVSKKGDAGSGIIGKNSIPLSNQILKSSHESFQKFKNFDKYQFQESIKGKRKVPGTLSMLPINSPNPLSKISLAGPSNRSIAHSGTPLTSQERDLRSKYMHYRREHSRSLWPVEGSGDRVLEQILYYKSISPDARKKIIFLNGDFDYNLVAGQSRFQEDGCLVKACSISFDTRDEATADLLLHKDYAGYSSTAATNAEQVHLLFLLESPLHTADFRQSRTINWTATYRSDSVLNAPYERFTYFRNFTRLPHKSDRNYALKKTKKVAWFVSNCHTMNGRENYAKELAKYIPVDIYGACGTRMCTKNSDECRQMLRSDYKFYLSFENSNCRDYITEKFFVNALSNDVLPIVMGAPFEDYRRLAPPESFIHVDSFESPKALAQYLHLLDRNDDLYNRYFRWKGSGAFIDTKFWCRLCALLHEADVSKTRAWYDDVEQWWRGEGVCAPQDSADGWSTWRNFTSSLQTAQSVFKLHRPAKATFGVSTVSCTCLLTSTTMTFSPSTLSGRKLLNQEEMTSAAKKMFLIKVTKDTYKAGINRHLHYTLMKDCLVAELLDYSKAACLCVRDVLALRWFRTQQHYYQEDVKRVYYLSMEFYLGRALSNSLICLGNDSIADEALYDLGLNLEELEEAEVEAALGNGGMGRLAACFLDSMATMGIPGYGYGLKYEYGMFSQVIKNGYQYEEPNNWLKHGNPWMVSRPEHQYKVPFGGTAKAPNKKRSEDMMEWLEEESVLATPTDLPIPGYRNDHVNTLRLWSAKAPEDFNFSFFNSGDYVKAVMRSNLCENITRVLYPNDKFFQGKQLRLRQEYLLVASSLQDIVRRFKKSSFYARNPERAMERLYEKVAIQLNDTHASMVVPELMRLLLDHECLSWDEAWNCTVKCLAYTNSTTVPESLERWPVEMVQSMFPRHMQIINGINDRFLEYVKSKFPNDSEKLSNVSLVTDKEVKEVAMAHLCVVGCHVVNGVSAVHTHILKTEIFKDFVDIFPKKFINITNGITPRRWLLSCNPALALLIIEYIGTKWLTQMTDLKKLDSLNRMEAFCTQLQIVKQKNKLKFTKFVKEKYGLEIDSHSIFDFQVKRLHEYKRQLLTILHIITLYNRLRIDPQYTCTPRTVIMGGKAAPGYQKAKLVIKLFNNVAAACNSDPNVRSKLKCLFLSDYNISLAEKVMPAADLSEHLSLAGSEACGTGNMKFMLNGALTIGTLDGSNVEMREHVGEENFFVFGLTAREVQDLRKDNYHPSHYYDTNEDLRTAIEQISSDFFSPGEPHLFLELANSLRNTDYYMVCADYESYVECQEKVARIYTDGARWNKMVAANLAASGHFSSDRAIGEYCEKVWNVEPSYNRMKLT